jgi:hypothetical protein
VRVSSSRLPSLRKGVTSAVPQPLRVITNGVYYPNKG